MANRSARYNEPLPRRRTDQVPRVAVVARSRLEPVVRARLQLEQELRTCANGPHSRRSSWSTAHQTALLAMLSETDSPLAASLRARAAAAVGPIKLNRAVPALRRMVLDEQEDLQTRLNAAVSYIGIRGPAVAVEVPRLLRSKEPAVRAAIYVAALRSEAPRLVAAAGTRFGREKDARVRSVVLRRVPRLAATMTTKADS